MTVSGVPDPRDGEGQGGAQQGDPPDAPTTAGAPTAPPPAAPVAPPPAEAAPTEAAPEPVPKVLSDQEAVDAFPVTKLAKLDELISNPRCVYNFT